MIELDMQVDTVSATLFLRGVKADAIPIATTRALNKVIVTVRKEAADRVHRVRRMKKGILKKNMTIVRANRRNLTAHVIASNRPVSLKHYSAKVGGRKNHKRVIINITGQREVLEHAFILQGKRNGHVYERVGEKALPIRRLSGPSIGSALISGAVLQSIRQVVNNKWSPVFTREVQFEIDKRAARSKR